MRHLTYAMFRGESGCLVAQGVEVDLCTSTSGDENDLQERVMDQLRCQIELDRQRGRETFATNRPAPKRFAEMARRGSECKHFNVHDAATVSLVDCR